MPEHGEMWLYRLGSGSYSQNAAWQMALRCFANALVELTGEVSVAPTSSELIRLPSSW